MRLKAMAKINLGLDVLGKREDGYHEVRMIMQTIRMYDILDIRKTKRPGIVLTTNLPFIPTDSRNLVYKAAEMLMEEFEIEEGLSIKLRKFIPVAAGMAGGSSDAAGRICRCEPDVSSGPDGRAADGARSEGRSRCSVLYHAWNSPCRGNR